MINADYIEGCKEQLQQLILQNWFIQYSTMGAFPEEKLCLFFMYRAILLNDDQPKPSIGGEKPYEPWKEVFDVLTIWII